jgi:mannose-6-phosphate isomerase-like protein (cupin superfamily)
MKAGKVWGTTELIEANGALEFHRIEMEAGGVCSKHLHRYKWNGFYVESGKMLVRVWQRDYDLVDETVVGPNQYTKVKPGLYHQFECLESGVAYELYWAEFNHNDIVRETVGEMKYELTESPGITIDIDNDEFPDITIGIDNDGSYISWPGEDGGPEDFSTGGRV